MKRGNILLKKLGWMTSKPRQQLSSEGKKMGYSQKKLVTWGIREKMQYKSNRVFLNDSPKFYNYL
jgi:hypothetical protein